MSTLATKTSPPKLSEVAKHVVAPSGMVATGWPAIEAKCLELGVRFRRWQPPVGRLILAKRSDGKYAATIGGTGLSIPRQVGKTFLVGAIVFALCLLFPNLTVIWTSHRLRTAEETFGKMQAFAKRRRIAPHVLKLVLGSGDEAILFRNGSRILFGARERGFGRGFDEVDVLIFDEAQILTDAALDDMVPATNQSRQPTGALLLFMGTPPKPTDPGEVFRRMRSEALSGEDDDTGWVEFGADEGYTPPPLPAPLTGADWRQVSKANPSYPDDTPAEAIQRMRKKLGPDSYLREGLGLWDEDEKDGPFPGWEGLADTSADEAAQGHGTSRCFGLATAPDASWSAIAVAWRRPDGLPQVMLADYRRGSVWVPDRMNELRQKWGGSVAVDVASRGLFAGAVELSQGDQAQAHAALSNAVKAGTVRHGNDRAMNIAAGAARWRPMGDTQLLDRKGSTDISPIAAAALAVRQVLAAPPAYLAGSF